MKFSTPHYVTVFATVFDTRRGSITSIGTVVTKFFFPQLKPDNITTHQFEVINDSSDSIVIGRGIMNALKFNFKDKGVQWEECVLRLNTGQNKDRVGLFRQEEVKFSDESKEAK